MLKKTQLLSYLITILTSFNINAQHNNNSYFEISGYVKNNKKAIPFCNIYIKDSNIGTTSDENGKYTLKLKHGDYTITAQSLGFKKNSKKVHLDNNLKLNFNLKEDILGLEQVVVTATKTELNRKEAPILVNITNSKVLQNTQSNSLLEGLNFQPGLRTENNCQNCGFTQIRINGLDGAYSQILINSKPIFSSLNGVYGLEQIPSNIIKQIEVTRGGGSAIFGANAIAGTINIITKNPIENSFEVNTKFNLINYSVPEKIISFNSSNVSKDTKKGITFFGTYRNRKEFDANNDGFSEITKINNINFGLKSFFEFSNYKKLNAELMIINEFRRGGNSFDLPPHQALIAEEIKNNIISGGISYNYFSKNYKNKISLYLNTVNTKANNYYGTNKDPDGYGITKDFTTIAGIQHTVKAKKNITLTSGLEANYNTITEDRKNALITFFNQKIYTAGLFTQIDWKVKNNFKILTGIRADYFNSNKRNKPLLAFNPRLNLLYNINKSWNIRTGYSKGFRAPQFFSEDVHSEIITGEIRNIQLAPNLKKETSNSYTGSVEYSHQHNEHQFLVSIEGFYTSLNNPFIYENRGFANNGLLIKEKINGSNAIVKGINLELKYSPNNNFLFQLASTFQNGTYSKNYTLEDGITTNKILRSPQLYANSFINYSPNNWDFNLSAIYTGPMYTTHLAGYINNNKLVKTPNTMDIGINAGYTFNINKDQTLKVTSGIKNIFNNYQNDFDKGVDRDPTYIYGPNTPKTFLISLKYASK